MSLLNILVLFSAFSFLFFGLGCFFFPRMKTEFIRYGLKRQRTFVGLLQLIGAIGLLVGYFHQVTITIISAFGLCLLMILGFGVRLKIRDSVLQSAPAFFYALINGYIFLKLANLI
jgi:hypothetical protein